MNFRAMFITDKFDVNMKEKNGREIAIPPNLQTNHNHPTPNIHTYNNLQNTTSPRHKYVTSHKSAPSYVT